MLEQRLAKMEQILLSDSTAATSKKANEAETASNAEKDTSTVITEGDEEESKHGEELPICCLDDYNNNNNNSSTPSNNSIRNKSASKRSSEDTLHDAASPTSFSSISSNFPSPPAHMINHHHQQQQQHQQQQHQQQQQQQHQHQHQQQHHHHQQHQHSLNQENCNDLLPSMDVIEHMVDLYFKYLFSGTPIFDEATLRNDVRDHKCSDFTLLSLFAACARYVFYVIKKLNRFINHQKKRFSDRPDVKETPAWHAGEKYAEKARTMILKAVDEPTISNLQGLTLLCLHEYGCGRGPRSWMYGGMAIRMAIELGLHEDSDEDENGNDNHTLEKLMQQETRRRLFWTIYSIDKFSSAATGRPSILQDSFCTAFLPAKVDDCINDQYYTENLDNSRFVLLNVNGLKESQLLGSSLLTGFSNIDPSIAPKDSSSSPLLPSLALVSGGRPSLNCFAYLIRAASLLGRVTAFINSKAKDQRNLVPPCHPDSEFSKLDRAITEWYEQLPLHLKDSPENFEKYENDHRYGNSRQLILVMDIFINGISYISNLIHCSCMSSIILW